MTSHPSSFIAPTYTPMVIDDSITAMGGDRFINRELSWLKFQRRVQEEAMNKNVPLLERLRFLSIAASNLDEFHMVRVAGLMQMVEAGIEKKSPDGLNPVQQLDVITAEVTKLSANQQLTWASFIPELAAHGIDILKNSDMTQADVTWLNDWFVNQIFPALTPLAVDSSHPFPYIPNKGVVMVLEMERASDGKVMKGLVPVPYSLPRFVQLPACDEGGDTEGRGKRHRFIALENIFENYLDMLFPGFAVKEYGMFRILRDSELGVNEKAEDLVATFEDLLRQRRFGNVVRLVVLEGISEALVSYICGEFNVPADKVRTVSEIMDLSSISQLTKIGRPDLLFSPMDVRFPPRIDDFDGDYFMAIAHKDLIVHHPFESFDVVVGFLEQAARDDTVIAIKQTLYRTSDNSPIVAALIRAAERGKSVTAVVEIKARFDEAANIRWARDMERAGVQVVYGFTDLKTHAKLSMVVRRERDEIRTYCHIGTGNYHPITAKSYIDLSLFTCHHGVGQDIARIFNFMTGYARPEGIHYLAVSPFGIRERIMAHIMQEINNAKAGKPSGIYIKVNNIVDPHIMDALYQASQAGVPIELLVRGICCIRAGVKGLSENITVKAIVGRFLEHSRIYCFASGHPMYTLGGTVYIGSADLMPRNLNRRVETLVPILNETVKQQIIGQVIYASRHDNKQSWLLQSDGHFQRCPSEADGFSAHEFFMTHNSLSGQGFDTEQGDGHG